MSTLHYFHFDEASLRQSQSKISCNNDVCISFCLANCDLLSDKKLTFSVVPAESCHTQSYSEDWDFGSEGEGPESPGKSATYTASLASDDHDDPDRRLSDEARERYASFVRARRASRSRLRVIRTGQRDEYEADDGSIPTFCPHCHKEYRQNNRFFFSPPCLC